MNTTLLSLITLALAGTLAVHAQETAPEGGRRGPGNRPVPPAVLKEFDKDGDGKLGEDERKAMREATQARREAARKKMLEKYDADKDGKLSDEERKTMRADMEAKRKVLIEKYDANKNNRLDPAELKTAREAGEELPPQMGRGGREGGRRGPGGEGRGPRPDSKPAGE